MSTEVEQLVADLERHKEARRWSKVVETIEQLLANESDAMRRAAWRVSGALIHRDELLNREQAIEWFDAALDDYFVNLDELDDARLPMALGPFHRLVRMHTDNGEWRPLDRAYRKMIVRVRSSPRFDKLGAELFDKLGELYRTYLASPSSARAAFEEARKLDPGNELRTEGVDRDGFLATPAEP